MDGLEGRKFKEPDGSPRPQDPADGDMVVASTSVSATGVATVDAAKEAARVRTFMPTTALKRSPGKVPHAPVCANESVMIAAAPHNVSFRQVVQSCEQVDVNNALTMLMKNAVNSRQRTISSSTDPGEDSSAKRKLELSPEKATRMAKERKVDNPTFEAMERMIVALDKMVQEQKGAIKKATKLQSTLVMEYFRKLKATQSLLVGNSTMIPSHKMKNDVLLIRSKMDKATTLEELSSLIDEPWPTGSYKITKLDQKCKPHIDDALVSFIVWPENFGEDKNFLEMAKVVPGVQGITQEKLRDMVHMEVSCVENVVIPGIENSNRARNTLIYGAVLSDPGLLETADLIKWADQVKAYATGLSRDNIIICFPNDSHLLRIRKVFECRLNGSDLKVTLKPLESRRPPQRKFVEDAIIIGGGSYADVLKNLQKEIDTDACGVRVKVSKTNAGDVRLNISETRAGGRVEMEKRIGECIATECTMKKVTNTKAIIISNIGEDVDKDQVKEALSNLTGIASKDIVVNEFRGIFRGYKSVTVFLPPQHAINVLSGKHIRIGWYTCKVKERVEPDFCQRCQIYGHATCNRPQLKKRCLKCGGYNHLVKDCTEEEDSCFTCNLKGHRANSMRCQVFRELVEAKRRNNA